MRTSFALASVLTVVSTALASCDEASRFGNSVLVPSTNKPLVAGDTVKITTNYTCALQYGIKPNWTEYTLGVFQNNNGYEATYWLGRVDNPPKISTVTLKIPAGYYWANASYDILVGIEYPIKGTDGSPVYTSGGQFQPVKLAPTN